MKTVKVMGDALNKVADTSTVFDFWLWNEGLPQDVTGKTVSFTIANDSGYLFDVPAVIDGNVVSLDFSNELLKQLTPDTYHMEVSVTNSDGDVEVYPSEGAIDFRVGKNLHSTAGKLVPQITFDTVLRSVDEKIAEYTKTIAKGDKGDTGPKGDKGDKGDTGLKGDKGDQGPMGPQGERGKQIFKSSAEYYEPNSSGHWWSDLSPAVSLNNPPKVGDTLINYSGNIFQINAVNVGDGGGGGGTFGVGVVLGNITGPQGPKGDKGDKGDQGPMGPQGPVSASMDAFVKKTNELPAEARDFGYLAQNMQTYQGFWWNGAESIANAPADNWTRSVIEVIPGNAGSNGVIRTMRTGDGIVYSTNINFGYIQHWTRFADDANVVHKTGNETIANDKMFTGKISVNELEVGGDKYATTATATANYYGVDISFLRVGKQVIFTSSVNSFNSNLGVGLTGGVIPFGFRPALQQNVRLASQDGPDKFLSFGQDGAIYTYSAYSSGTQPRISGSYITTDSWPNN